MNVRDPVVKARRCHFVIPGISAVIAGKAQLAVMPAFGVVLHAVIAKPFQAGGQFRIVGGNYAALAHGDGLDRMAGENSHLPITAASHRDLSALGSDITPAQGMAGVLHHRQTPFTGQPRHHFHVHALAAEMNRINRFEGIDAAIQRRAKRGFIEQPRFRVHVGEDHLGPGMAHRVGGGEKGHRRHHHHIIRTQAQAQGSQM